MLLNRLSLSVCLALCCIHLTLVSSGNAWATSPMIRVDGSSTVFPITEAVAEEFQAAVKGKIRVVVGISGTGGGFKKFCRGETEVQDASRPISDKEIQACKKSGVSFYELPIAYDAMAIVVNPQNNWLDSITVDELKKIWEPTAQGKITSWKQVNPKWPDRPLKLFGAGPDSGTFDYFTEAIVGKSKASRGDYTASEDDNALVQGIASDAGALGYLPVAYYEMNKKKIKIVPVMGGPKAPKKTPVLPSIATVNDGSYYPLSRPIFIYVSGKDAQRPDVQEFVTFYLNNAGTLSGQVMYIPLPKSSYTALLKRFQEKKMGTAFKDVHTVGLKIDDLLKLKLQ